MLLLLLLLLLLLELLLLKLLLLELLLLRQRKEALLLEMGMQVMLQVCESSLISPSSELRLLQELLQLCHLLAGELGVLDVKTHGVGGKGSKLMLVSLSPRNLLLLLLLGSRQQALHLHEARQGFPLVRTVLHEEKTARARRTLTDFSTSELTIQSEERRGGSGELRELLRLHALKLQLKCVVDALRIVVQEEQATVLAPYQVCTLPLC